MPERFRFVGAAHKEDVNRIFLDLRDDTPKPAQSLVRRTHYEVVEVEISEQGKASSLDLRLIHCTESSCIRKVR